jgi:acetyl-CoA acetyltransferase
MTRAPWVLPKPSRAFPAGNVTAVSTTLGWRLVNDRMRAEWTVSLGEVNEQLAETYGIGRERLDEFAARSHNVAAAARDAGFYDDLVVPVPDVDLARDEGVRPGSTAERLSGLKPSFRPDGTITPGNASPLNEALAVQSLPFVDAWLDLGLADPDLVNATGGAIVIGHPLGASGARIVATLFKRLHELGGRWGVAAICVGVGQALAVVLENLRTEAS